MAQDANHVISWDRGDAVCRASGCTPTIRPEEHSEGRLVIAS